ncbi:VOC family protein [Effusibacillus dendaii]|uniref:VOC domain-containing protein n=1 Tax=Effusibacillus dendaii TaxID=2743772 RepID=A0A7I8DAC3_9BACL|nr:VOC family protein [Effusibacillus dendaii]BCJ87045.1 hypothetical protein skT53_20300 [Effusibacillus dendaii]
MLVKPLHINLVAYDLDVMLDFYRNVLGFEVIVQSEIANEAYCRGAGLPDASVKMARLRLPGSDFGVEMVQYNDLTAGKIGSSRPNQAGYRHMAFQVQNLEQSYQELMSQGASFVSPPLTDGRSASEQATRFCFLRDPEGNYIELMQVKDE